MFINSLIIQSRTIKPVKIALTGGTIVTKHENMNIKTTSANSQIFGFSKNISPQHADLGHKIGRQKETLKADLGF